MPYDLEELKKLSEEERQYVLHILDEVSTTGSSDSYDNILYEDYEEIPVDIETFLTDDKYLGQAWKDASGKSKIYPFWMEQLKKLFPTNVDTNYNTLLESGARGIGKSEIACGAVGAYLMYRVLCLKNPLEFYHLKLTEKICFAFMNIKLALSEEIAISKFQKTIQMSPWFMKRGSMTSFHGNPYWVPPEPIKIIIGSQADDVIGQPIFFSFFDEISFIRNQDIDKQKKKAKDMIDTAIGGMMTRFIHKGKNPTLLAVASSKRSEQSFMEEYIKTLSEKDGTNTLVIDKPVWEVKPEGTYNKDTFFIGLGNKFLESIVIPDEHNNNLDIYKEKGYHIIEAPVDFKAKALEDLDRMLCDYAGISSSSLNKYMSASRVMDVINTEYKNPFPDIIEVGNGKDDLAEYKNFFNMENIPKNMMSRPLFVHLDMSISGDMTGIAGVWITGKKTSTDSSQQSNDLNFRLAFSVSIKAPKGRQISFEKNRNFIRWLKEVGFKVRAITSDTFQSYDLQQQLMAEGFECSMLSVDRVDSDRICKPYQYLKSTIYENRFEMYKSDRLFDEFVQLERNIDTGKVDHPQNGHKDALDAVCGATFNASKYAEEFAFNYGEVAEHVIKVNNESVNAESEKKQIQVAFEEELQKMFDPVTKKLNAEQENKNEVKKENSPKPKSPFMDFGMGPAEVYKPSYLSEGIIFY